MTLPKLTREDHKLRRSLIKKLGPKGAFDFVVGKALDREKGAKK